jgi:hypothetical protein
VITDSGIVITESGILIRDSGDRDHRILGVVIARR